ncbi:Glutathione transport system permease protein GsiD [bacterium HR29]|jgi:peptide/nickel transport system permease protein|nr:Glutathione transport system permease protein GsiD [bacterium HR29]
MAEQQAAAILEQYALRPEAPFARRAWRALRNFVVRKPLGTFGAAVILLLLIFAAFPGLFATHDPNAISPLERYQGPSASHWFGTDQFGRDVYSRIVYGARTSIIIGFGVVALSATLATLIGTISGYFGGWFDILVQRLVDIAIALPGLVFIILVIQTLLDLPVLLRLILALGVLISFGLSRVVRGASIATKQFQYVEAARVIGAGDMRIVFRHILPNVVAVVLVGASIQVGGAILIESSLSFLGYGVQPPTASWGRMLNEAREQMIRAPHLAIFPGFAIFFAVFAFNMFGDALRDVLDPRLRGSR